MRAPARGYRGRAMACGFSWRSFPSTVCVEALSGGEAQLRARVHQVGVRLDPAHLRVERVPLRLQEVELRDGPGAVPLPRLRCGVEGGLAAGASGAAASDARNHGVPFAVDGVAGREQCAELAGAGRVRRRVLRADVGEVGE